jgi:ribosomal protein L24E
MVNKRCAWCGNSIVKGKIIRVYRNEKIYDDYEYCSDYCAKLALLVWLHLIKGVKELK